MGFPCRCRRCEARRTLARPPRDERCACGGSYRVDWYRKRLEHKRTACYCSAYWWSGPHRRGGGKCCGQAPAWPDAPGIHLPF